MTWLEKPQDDAERLLREGLDQAAQRLGDEITHRRVWAQVATATSAVMEPVHRPPRRWSLVVGTVGLGVAAAAAFFLAPRLLGHKHDGAMVENAVQQGSAPSDPAAVPAESTGPVQTVTPAEYERGPGYRVTTRHGEHARVALGGGAEAELGESSSLTWDRQHRPSIERGTAKLSVPHQPPGWRFSVTAGPYVVTVVGTKFDVHVLNRMVSVAVTEGIVEVWRGSRATRLIAGDSWEGPLYPDEPTPSPSKGAAVSPAPTPKERPAAAAMPEPAGAPAPAAPASRVAVLPLSRGLQDAQQALGAGDTGKAMELLGRLAQGSGPAAENAAYEMARIARYNLNRPRQAVALWEKYRTRFPSGLLRAETDLSIVETLSQMGEVRAALAEANAFLARYPNSERRFEVQKLTERLKAAAAGE